MKNLPEIILILIITCFVSCNRAEETPPYYDIFGLIVADIIYKGEFYETTSEFGDRFYPNTGKYVDDTDSIYLLNRIKHDTLNIRLILKDTTSDFIFKQYESYKQFLEETCLLGGNLVKIPNLKSFTVEIEHGLIIDVQRLTRDMNEDVRPSYLLYISDLTIDDGKLSLLVHISKDAASCWGGKFCFQLVNGVWTQVQKITIFVC